MNSLIRHTLLATAAVFAVLTVSPAMADDEFMFEGRKKCYNCHKAQGKSWAKTKHGKAMESLKPGKAKKAKLKAKLDPEKDYTEDKDCVGCHVDGFEQEGGYLIDDPDKWLTGVGCESCHGAGSGYRKLHRKAGEKFEKSQKTTPRKKLLARGEEFEFIEKCNACHLNYEGSGWEGTKKPYTPFTPEVDEKYAFDFEKYVRNDKAMHQHFKLIGTFTGDPTPKFHEEFQKAAKPLPKDEE